MSLNEESLYCQRVDQVSNRTIKLKTNMKRIISRLIRWMQHAEEALTWSIHSFRLSYVILCKKQLCEGLVSCCFKNCKYKIVSSLLICINEKLDRASEIIRELGCWLKSHKANQLNLLNVYILFYYSIYVYSLDNLFFIQNISHHCFNIAQHCSNDFTVVGILRQAIASIIHIVYYLSNITWNASYYEYLLVSTVCYVFLLIIWSYSEFSCLHAPLIFPVSFCSASPHFLLYLFNSLIEL